MSIGDIAVLMRDGIWHVFLLCAPVLGAAIIIGLIVAIFQATTSIQEQTLTFLPKLFIILLMRDTASPFIKVRCDFNNKSNL